LSGIDRYRSVNQKGWKWRKCPVNRISFDYGYEPDFYVYGGNIYHGRSADDQDNGVNKADRETLAETNTEAVQSCGDLAPGVSNLPIEQIQQTVHPTADQEAALDYLSAATSQASDRIRSSCPTAVPLTPVGRLDAAEQRLAATIKAIPNTPAC
jgi:hypothetical protein